MLLPGHPPPDGPEVRLVTIATPSLAASLRFYSRLGFACAEETDRQAPLAPAAGAMGPRRVETDASPAPNLDANLPDGGLAGLTLWTGDDGAAFMALEAAGVQSLSWPQYYRVPAAEGRPAVEGKLFTVIGPSGERVAIQRLLSVNGRPAPWAHAADFASGAAVLATRDRWPMTALYAALGARSPDGGRQMQQDPVNVAIGAPLGGYFHFGWMTTGLAWREHRADPPGPPAPARPLAVRCGVAMLTLAVADPDEARRAALAHGAVEAGGAVQGPDGELIDFVRKGAP